jgi:transposase
MMKKQPRFVTKFYYGLSLDRLVPEDHLLRHISNAIDFSFIRPLCRPFYSHTGRPSVDPVVLFKMLLIGYLYGITSERRLARELSLNLGYRWVPRLRLRPTDTGPQRPLQGARPLRA